MRDDRKRPPEGPNANRNGGRPWTGGKRRPWLQTPARTAEPLRPSPAKPPPPPEYDPASQRPQRSDGGFCRSVRSKLLTFYINLTYCKTSVNEEPGQSNHAIYNHRHNRVACPILGVLGRVDFHVGAYGRGSGGAPVSPANRGSDSSGNHGRGALALHARALGRNLGTDSRHRRCMRNYRGWNSGNFDRIDLLVGRARRQPPN